jgi:hypothetical protein
MLARCPPGLDVNRLWAFIWGKDREIIEIIVVHFLKNVVQKLYPNNNSIPKGYFTSSNIIFSFTNFPDQPYLRQ